MFIAFPSLLRVDDKIKGHSRFHPTAGSTQQHHQPPTPVKDCSRTHPSNQLHGVKGFERSLRISLLARIPLRNGRGLETSTRNSKTQTFFWPT